MRSQFLWVTVALASLGGAAIGSAAPVCPPEVKEASDLLKAKSAAAHKPRSQAAAREQEIQAPRGQEMQAPRGQEIQAPRGEELQAPRTRDHPEPPTGPVPRGQDVQAPQNVAKGRANALANVRRLVSEAELACKDGDSARATSNARAAIELLKYLP